ncbi:hypothetical protein FBEOM_3292 [Fusarium beomiforme]|uniref:Uncharacterized protein n=1 Tax=Fusarium beomiforme TaxID=44412 RepID=A0A9P5APZ9_9HYPO|nr:hypothetical protein FBEOM_3292 [Fusarium beomiforme]
MSSRSNKRPNTGAPANAPPAKKGRLSKAELSSQVPKDGMNRVQARRMLETNPRLTRHEGEDEREFYRKLVFWPEGSVFSGDEKDILEEWDESIQKPESSKFSRGSHSPLANVWRVCLRLYRISPVILWSPLHGLQYQPATASAQAYKTIPSGTFCSKLLALLVHPCWDGEIKDFCCALQWTIICRIDDRRPWFPSTAPCEAFRRFCKEIEEHQNGMPRPYFEAFEEARNRSTRRSQLAELMYNIGKAVQNESDATPQVPDDLTERGLHILPVTIWDLTVLTKAVNSTTFKNEWNYTVEDALVGWNAEIRGQDLPPLNKLPLVHELANKELFRHLYMLERGEDSDESEHDNDTIASGRPQSSEEIESEPGNLTRPPRRPSRYPRVQESDDEGDDRTNSSVSQRHPTPQSHTGGEDFDMGEDSNDGDFDVNDFNGRVEDSQSTRDRQHERSVEEVLRRGMPTLSQRPDHLPPFQSVYSSLPSAEAQELSALRREVRKLQKDNDNLSAEIRDMKAQFDSSQSKMQAQLTSLHYELKEVRAQQASNRGERQAVLDSRRSAQPSPELNTDTFL